MERTDENTVVSGRTPRGCVVRMMSSDISNSDDIIDSRSVIARIRELEDDLKTSHSELLSAGATPEFEQWLAATADSEGTAPHAEAAGELVVLRELQDQAEGYADDWRYGAQLIRESHFKTFARELAEDVGAIKSDLSWPYTCIDWDQAAEDLQQNYTPVDFDGITYYIR